MSERILLVDDEPAVLDGIRRQLRNRYDLTTAVGPKEGLIAIEEGEPFGVVVSDMRMPGMNGVEFLAKVRMRHPDTVRMVLTGQSDMSNTVAAINEGNVFRFLLKPCPPDDLAGALEAGLKQHRLVIAERELLEETLKGAVGLLTDVVAMVDPATFSRSGRVQRIMGELLHHLDAPFTWELRIAGMLSLIGYLSIPPEVLAKARSADPLDEEEVAMLQAHPGHARQLLVRIPRLEGVAEIVGQQGSPSPASSLSKSVSDWGTKELGVQVLTAAVRFDELRSSGEKAAAAFDSVRSRGDLHPRIIDALSRVRIEDDSEVKKLNAFDLRIGMIFDEDVRTKDGGLLLAKEYEVTEAIILRLRSHAERGALAEPLRVRMGYSEDGGPIGSQARADPVLAV